ncbi:MAG: NADP-dependent oxidoreductase [Thermoplasmata archaeon]
MSSKALGPNRQWLFAQRAEGPIGQHNFRWVESGAIPSPTEGQALVRNLWISFAPTSLLHMSAPPEQGGMSIGDVMQSQAASVVIESRHPGWAPGDLLVGFVGWEDYSLTDGHAFIDTYKAPAGVPPNLAVGTLGITGLVAYFGVLDVGRPHRGETFVVTAAAGGVGSIAAQIAKIQGLRVIGIAGGRQKCDWLLDTAGIDAVIDHRTENVAARLDALCPDGIDIFFDNVGGAILDEGLGRLRRNGRVVVCGGTALYGQKVQPPGPLNYLNLCMVNGRMEGLLGRDYFDRFPEAIAVLRGWLDTGQLKSKEDVAVGLENAPDALARMFRGENIGKQLLKIADLAAEPSN